jgi:Transposase DDE domain
MAFINCDFNTSSTTTTLKDRFFAPLSKAVEKITSGRKCPVFSDSEWILGGVRRVLDSFDSGRDFLQRLLDGGSYSGYFNTLKSERRLQFVTDLEREICAEIENTLPDQLSQALPQLDGFNVYAGDGHFHTHATHDYKDQDKKYAVGHLYGLNLRTKALFHLTCADQENRDKENDIRALKRLEINELRQDSPKGKKVIWVWDRAGIDFRQWHHWKKQNGIYFISRTKKNMKTDQDTVPLTYDKSDPINQGGTGDFLWATSCGVQMRVVRFYDVTTGELFEYVTSLTDRSIPPGVIVQLYRMRWDIEKSYDVIKNKIHEKKAWATTANAKTIQAKLITITYNLMLLFESEIEESEGIKNEAEDKRRNARVEKLKEEVKQKGEVLPELYLKLIRVTQVSVKFVRWLRYEVLGMTSDNLALERLRDCYSKT